MLATIEDILAHDIRVGTIRDAEFFGRAKFLRNSSKLILDLRSG